MCNSILVKIKVKKGDITKEDTDAIVNAANGGLMGGGGVDGAIHRAAGRKIVDECKEIINKIGYLKTGEAVITSGGDLKAKYIIHTVGPVWNGGNNNEENLLSNAYKNSLRIASENNVKTIAFPGISTGVYGYPKDLAAKTAYDAVKDSLRKYNNIDEVRFVCFDNESYNLYCNFLHDDMKRQL